MTEKEIAELVAAAVGDVDLSDTEIPGIDLYLDQILSLVTEKNSGSSPRYRDRSLTKTMVNNYSKDGLISPINGKKYSRAHIVEMLLVYALKNTLTIDEIKRVLTGVREGCGFTGADIIEAYHRFLDLKENNRQRAAAGVKALLQDDGLSPTEDKDFFLLLLDILSLSAYLKEIARELIEARYEDVEAMLRERKEQQKADKREREAQEKSERKKEKESRKKAAEEGESDA